ncbi:MAG TPA: 16S rRNA (uracil(1498)-N(3))-methyltransferase [Ferruginibacter sp.]|nr:16S rRNA (uracil(1498)-N(3))-methyltransferase [Ferruginibacter sp.]
MKLPLFYKQDINTIDIEVVLDEATSKHIIQVLRMKNGEQLQLTNGKGNLFTVQITDDNRKKCSVNILQKSEIKHPKSEITIAISPVKNSSRFEWFLEKATEIGVTQIVPLLCERTEKQHFKFERMQGILVSAMLQSQQAWLPVVQEPVKFIKYVEQLKDEKGLQKYIAHCEDETNKIPLIDNLQNNKSNKLILIGPEGDFTKAEITLALTNHFIPVTLGDTRLRTETAGMVAAALMCNI